MTINVTDRSETLCQHDPYSYVQYIIIIYIGSPIALIGIFCNSLLVVLFTDQPNRSTPTLYFLILAYLDIGICLLYLALFGVDAYAIYHEIYWMWRMWISYVMPCLVGSKVIQLCSTYIVVAATIERCWITFHSNAERKEKQSPNSAFCCTSRSRILALTFIFVVVFCLRIVSLWDYNLETKNECRGVDDFATVQFVPLIIDWHFYKNIFNFYIVHFVQVFLPISALILLNVVILWRLRLRYKYQRVDLGTSLVDGGDSAIAKISSKVKSHHNVREAAYSMVAIVTTYLACNSLSLFISIVEYFRVGWVTTETLGFLADIVSFLFLLNSFLRLFIHLLCNGTLRSTVRQWTVVRLRRCAEISPFSVWSRWRSERLMLNSPRCVQDPCHSESLNYCDVIMENVQVTVYESTV